MYRRRSKVLTALTSGLAGHHRVRPARAAVGAVLGIGALLIAMVSTMISGLPLVSSGKKDLVASAASNASIYLPIVYKGYPPSYSPPSSIFAAQMDPVISDANGLQQAKQAGVEWVRITLLWSDIEPKDVYPRVYDWSKYDPMFINAAQAGMIPIVIVRGNPGWASTTQSGPIDRVPVSRFAEFLANLVNHYKDAPYGVKFWELYNEPDNSQLKYDSNGGFWGYNGKDYADMLKAAYPAIKSADSQAQVLLGGLAYDWFTDNCDPQHGCGPFVKTFIDDVLANGGGQYFDYMNFHFYKAFASVWAPYGPDIIGKTTALRNELAKYGVNKPFICSEVGMWSSPPDGSNQIQSDYVFQVYARAMAADLKSVIWFSLVDGTSGPQRGLLDTSLTPKPAYYAYKTLSNQLAGFTYQATSSSVYGTTSDVEGYVFTSPDGKTKKTVLWLDGSTVSRSISFPSSQLTVIDTGGNTTSVSDGGSGDLDGQTNGKVTVQITQDPVIVTIGS